MTIPNLRATLLAGLLLASLASGASAAEPSAAEWRYLQCIDAMGKVGEQLQRSAENNGWANRDLMAYANELTRFNAAQLRRWDAPVPELRSAHRQLIHVLDLAARHYEALARGNYGDAEDRGEDLKREYQQFEKLWREVMARYENPR